MPDSKKSQQPKLLDKVQQVLRLHHYSIHTEQGGQGVPSPLDDLGV